MEKLIKDLNKQNNNLCKIFKTMGSSVVIFNNNEIIYKYNYGYINKEKQIKTSDDSYFMIGSNTKVLTSLAIFKLLEENKLSLDDDIKKYIPEFSIKSLIEYDKITIQNLLMHRSGIQSDLYNYIFDDTKEYHQIIDAVKDTYLTSKPGTMYSYSNIGYTLLGIIIERISSLSYEEYLNEYISKPLNIDIRINPQLNDDNLSLSYDKSGKPTKDKAACLFPAGSNTYMKIADLVKIGQLFLNNGVHNGKKIYEPSTIEKMKQLDLNTEIDQMISNAGHGLLHNDYHFDGVGKIYGHGGDTICHHSMFNFIPEQNIGVIVFTNSEKATMLSRILGISNLSRYLSFLGYNIPKKLSNEYKHIDLNVDKYIGTYATLMGILDIKKDKKGNLVTTITNVPIKLVPCEDEYLQAYPNKLLYKLPLFKNSIKNIRLKLIKYNDEEILLLEQINKNQKTKVLIGKKYKRNEKNNLWYSSLGEYKIINYNQEKAKFKLELDKDKIRLIIDLKVEKITKYLYIINDNLSFVQGFGRETNDGCFLEEKDNKIYLTCNGLIGVKEKEIKC